MKAFIVTNAEKICKNLGDADIFFYLKKSKTYYSNLNLNAYIKCCDKMSFSVKSLFVIFFKLFVPIMFQRVKK